MTKDAQFALRRGERRAAADPRDQLQQQLAKPQSTRRPYAHAHAHPPPPPPLTPSRSPRPLVIEKYTRNTRFCLICNYVIKIIPALQSRCTRFRFPPLAPEHVRVRLEHVVQQEG
jgi:hypothetical protein